MKQKFNLNSLAFAFLLLAISCSAQKSASLGSSADAIAPDSASGLLSDDALLEEAVESEISNTPSEEQLAKIKENDKKFIEKFKSLSEDEKREVVKKIKKIIAKILELDEDQRRVALQKMKPPLPSKKVLDKLLKKNDSTSNQ